MYYHNPVTVQKKDIVKLLQKTPALHILLKMAKKTHPRDPSGYAAAFRGLFSSIRDLNHVTAARLTELICTTLSTYNLPISMCIWQNNDGASVMTGKLSVVQARICQVCSQARYIHCFAHRLNLVLVDSSKTVIAMRDFFSVLQMLYVFLSSSAVLPVFEGAQKQKGKNKANSPQTTV